MVFNLQPTFLTKNNYPVWKRDILRLFEMEGLSVWLTATDHPKLEGKSAYEDFKLKQSKVRASGLLKAHCNADIELEISHMSDPSLIWNHLTKSYEEPSRTNKAFRISEYRNLKCLSGEDITTFIAKLEKSYREVESVKETISEEQRCYHLLDNLDVSYDFVNRKFENCDEGEFKFENIKETVLKEYNRRKMKENRDENKTLSHTFIKRDNIEKKNNKDKIHSCFVIDQTKPLPNYPATKEWVVDSAATTHVCQNKAFFSRLNPASPGEKISAGTTPHAVEGIGIVKFIIREKNKIKYVSLKDVLYVPTISKNLISVPKMDENGYKIQIQKGVRVFSGKGQYQWSATRMGNLYVINGHYVKKTTHKRDKRKIEITNEGNLKIKYFWKKQGNKAFKKAKFKIKEEYDHKTSSTMKGYKNEQGILNEINYLEQIPSEEKCQNPGNAIYEKNTRLSKVTRNLRKDREDGNCVKTKMVINEDKLLNEKPQKLNKKGKKDKDTKGSAAKNISLRNKIEKKRENSTKNDHIKELKRRYSHNSYLPRKIKEDRIYENFFHLIIVNAFALVLFFTNVLFCHHRGMVLKNWDHFHFRTERKLTLQRNQKILPSNLALCDQLPREIRVVSFCTDLIEITTTDIYEKKITGKSTRTKLPS